MDDLQVLTIPYFNDNYCYLVRSDQKDTTILIDCGDADPVIEVLKEKGWKVDALFVTHYHPDHSAGVEDLKKEYTNLKVYKPKGEERLKETAIGLGDGELVNCGGIDVKAIRIPAHTNFCTAYYLNSDLFVGDALFSAGCGRMFEGKAENLSQAMEILGSYPEETRVYIGHEYTLANLQFAKAVEPENQDILAYMQDVESRLLKGEFTTPTTIGWEKRINPFLRIHEQGVIAHVDPKGVLDPVARMGMLRRKKDLF